MPVRRCFGKEDTDRQAKRHGRQDIDKTEGFGRRIEERQRRGESQDKTAFISVELERRQDSKIKGKLPRSKERRGK